MTSKVWFVSTGSKFEGSGRSPVGAALLVPEDRLEQVRDLLTCVVAIEDDGEGEER